MCSRRIMILTHLHLRDYRATVSRSGPRPLASWLYVTFKSLLELRTTRQPKQSRPVKPGKASATRSTMARTDSTVGSTLVSPRPQNSAWPSAGPKTTVPRRTLSPSFTTQGEPSTSVWPIPPTASEPSTCLTPQASV
jgi:hypothetical protein